MPSASAPRKHAPPHTAPLPGDEFSQTALRIWWHLHKGTEKEEEERVEQQREAVRDRLKARHWQRMVNERRYLGE